MKSDENNTDSYDSDKPLNPISNPIKILLIEDNPGDARLVVEYLKTDETFLYELHFISSLKDLNTISNLILYCLI